MKYEYSWLYFRIQHFHHLLKQVEWAWQRAVRGWSDDESWDIASRFLEVTPAVLRRMADRGIAYPTDMVSREEWEKILREMADGFDAGRKYYDDFDWCNGLTMEEIRSKEAELLLGYENAMKLFHTYFFSLWD